MEPSRGDGNRAPARYLVGDVIEDRYKVLSQLGAGGSSAVYQVHDDLRDEEVALKILDPEVGIEAPRRELKAASRKRHENIAEVIDIGRTTTVPPTYLVIQEYVPGVTLDHYCKPSGDRLEVIDVISILDQLLAALEAIHPDTGRIAELEGANAAGTMSQEEFYELQDLRTSGLVHRDVKPQNVRLREDGVVKLIDFGISSRAESTVYTTSATPEYSPPDADLFRWLPSYDLFAVGVIGYQLLTRTSPFTGSMPLLGRSSRMHDRLSDFGRPMCDFIERAIADDPLERFNDAAAMREALRTVELPALSAESTPDTSPVAASATEAGMLAQYERARSIAESHGLGMREYKRSLMITPATNRTRYLVNLAFHKNYCLVGVSESNWHSFHGVTKHELEAAFASPPPPSTKMDSTELSALLSRFDALLCALEAQTIDSTDR